MIVLLTVTGVSFAQTGSITGQVFDSSGAVIANATVIATSESTGATAKVLSSSGGLYNFAVLPPSNYTITASANGFQTQVRKGVTLNIAATLPLNFKLQVEGSSTSVEVQETGQAPVEADSFELSTVIDSKQINDLPLILRDPYQLVLLSPGVVTATNNVGGFSVNGQRDRNNNFMLDGADNNDTSVPGIQGGISSANPDSTQEFRIITNNFDAEYGRNTGAIIDVVTRGGGNKFHGDAYEFGRYNALGARDFFNKKADGKQDPYVRNDFGASVGGPIWKDHSFFFLNGEVQRFRTTRTGSQITPTAAYKSGKFTYIDPNDGSQTFVDLTTPNANNQNGLLLDPSVAKILAAIPTGQVDNGDGVTTTLSYPSPDPLNDYTLTGRFDQKLSARHQLTVRYNYGHSAEGDPFHDEVLPGLGSTASIGTNHNGVISIASSLTANTTNLLRAGYNQANSGFFCNYRGIDAVTGVDNFGIGRDVNLPSFFNLGCNDLGDSNGQARLSSTLLFADTFNITKSTHSIKFGGEYRSVKDNGFDNFSSRNSLFLNVFENYTNAAGDSVPAYNFSGDANSPNYLTFQDLVYGAQGVVASTSENQFFNSTGTRRGNDVSRFRQHEWAVFAQDTWKMTPKFTAIYGMRYAFNGVPYEKDGNFSNFYGDASAPVPAIGYFTFTQVGPGKQQLYADSWKLIEPRIGFAYDVAGNGKTAIRGGYGIFHDRIFDNLFGNAKSNPPFQAQQALNPFNPDAPSTSPTVSNIPNPGNLTPSAQVPDGTLLVNTVVIDPNLKMPTNQTYNIGVQRQINNRMTAEINYVGSHSTHVLREIDGNPPQPALVQQYLAAGASSASLTKNALYTSATPAVYNTAFLHELFQTSISNGNYNAFQAKIQGQLGGLNMTASYTYAHSLDNGSDALVPGAGNSGLPRNSFDLGPEYGSSDFDVRHRGTVAVNYSLPVGMGTSFLHTGLLGHVFEGIELSGIEQVQTGLPFDLRGNRDNLHTGLSNRPALIGPAYPSGRGTIVAQGKITGPSVKAFANAPYDQNVSIRRNKYYGPGFVNTDVVFQKTQTLREQVKLVFRAESYNLLNHPNLSSPPAASLSITSPTFGVSQSQVAQNDGTTGARQIQGALKIIF